MTEHANRLLTELILAEDIASDIDDDLESSQAECLGKLVALAREGYLLDHELRLGSARVNVAVIGSFSAGKSSFINALLGARICPVGLAATTSSITEFVIGEEPGAWLVADGHASAVEDYATAATRPREDDGAIPRFRFVHEQQALQNVSLFDTPGFDDPEHPAGDAAAYEICANADIVFYVFDINRGNIGQSSLQQIAKLRERAPDPLWHLVLNRSDDKATEEVIGITKAAQENYHAWFNDCFAFSSHDQLLAQEVGWQLLLRTAVQRISESISENRRDGLSVTVEPCPTACSVEIDGAQLTVRQPKCREDRSVHDVYRMLRVRLELKRELLSARGRRMREDALQAATLLKQGLRRRKSSMTGDDAEYRQKHWERQADKTSRFCESALHLAAQRAARDSATRERTSKRRFFSRARYRIKLRKSGMLDLFGEAPEWADISQRLAAFEEGLREEIGGESVLTPQWRGQLRNTIVRLLANDVWKQIPDPRGEDLTLDEATEYLSEARAAYELPYEVGEKLNQSIEQRLNRAIEEASRCLSEQQWLQNARKTSRLKTLQKLNILIESLKNEELR